MENVFLIQYDIRIMCNHYIRSKYMVDLEIRISSAAAWSPLSTGDPGVKGTTTVLRLWTPSVPWPSTSDLAASHPVFPWGCSWIQLRLRETFCKYSRTELRVRHKNSAWFFLWIYHLPERVKKKKIIGIWEEITIVTSGWKITEVRRPVIALYLIHIIHSYLSIYLAFIPWFV